MSVFTDAELRYLQSEGRLARLATVDASGVPHVVPTGFTYNAEHDALDVGGHDLDRSKKYRDVRQTGRAAIVVDDLASSVPWRPRGVEIRGRAEALDRPSVLIRIHPERVVSWGLDSEVLGARNSRRVR